MKETLVAILLLSALACCGLSAESAPVKISARPMHAGRISPMLFGGFIELLDDLVPGMWAEMLNDRGFEGLTKPSSWCYYDGASNSCDREWDADDTWSRDAKAPFNGPQCARLDARTDHAAALTQPGLAARKGVTYHFSGWLRADKPVARAEVALKTMLPNGKWMVLASKTLASPTAKWEKLSAQLTSRGTSDRVVFELRIIGTGSAWADKLSLMPAENVDGWRKDVVDAIRDMRPAIIRWGGSVCDPGGYRWKDGIGDRDSRVPFPNKVWGRIDPNDVGIDEFCRFCELVDAEPLICLSFSDGPQSAADLVRYCNAGTDNEWGAKRAANGHPKPYNVKYWQLGNELGNADYVSALPEFCAAMKQADPKAILMASFPSQEMLDRVGKDISYIGPHHYSPDFGACEADFKKLSDMIHNAPGCGHLRIAVTEWNVSGGYWGLMRGKFLTLETALLNARYLNLLMRYSNIVDIACRSNMTNSLGSGVIATNAAGLLKRPSYYVMKLYADHAKPVPVAVENAPEGVDMSACTSEDGKSLCVFAVNTKTEPMELTLDLGGFRPIGGEVVSDTLDQRQADVMNHWTAPDRVKTVKLSVSGSKVVLPALSASAIECERL